MIRGSSDDATAAVLENDTITNKKNGGRPTRANSVSYDDE